MTILRKRMVEEQLVARGIHDPLVLRAMEEVPREKFVPVEYSRFAYADSPLPIEENQTISQPYVVALMTEMLTLSPHDRVLEIGTGSGYAAAVLSRIAAEVYTVERHEDLARSARERFEQLGYQNIHIRVGDGTLGWPEKAPYEAIIFAAGTPQVPDPLLTQLAIGGSLVGPVGQKRDFQQLVRVQRKSEDEYQYEQISEHVGKVRFVPLVGKEGWPDFYNHNQM
jgi:protein-L-isoaspartate(D-aspartate) O-methyltransferase